MVAYVLGWLQRFQADLETTAALSHGDITVLRVDGLALDDAVKLHYRAWSFVDRCESQGEPVPEAALRRIVAGVPEDQRDEVLLDRRIVYVRPLEQYMRLPLRTPKTLTESASKLGLISGPPAPEDAQGPLYATYRNAPSILIDRATRGYGAAWNTHALTFGAEDITEMHLRYFDATTDLDVLKQGLESLDPRTSDVWRLLLAKAIEEDQDDKYTSVTLGLNDLAKALGLRPHPKGGMRAKDVIKCDAALMHLERLWLVPTPEGNRRVQYAAPGVTSDGKTATLVAGERVIAVMKKDGPRVVGGQQVHDTWEVVLGGWSKAFGRSYAPIFRSLVELPISSATHKWAKQIGTELAYMYRAAKGRNAKGIRVPVEDLLRNATILDEVVAFQHRRRLSEALERFEATLDLLGSLGVHGGWAYTVDSAEAMESAPKATRVDTWMTARVVITPPAQLLHDFDRLLQTLPPEDDD